jgi:hypothetical protein
MKKMIGFVVLVVLVMASCDITSLEILEADVEVTYRVTGTEASLITIEHNGTRQFSNVSLPWEYSFTETELYYSNMPAPSFTDEWVYISAQNAGNGSIKVEILMNGVVRYDSTSYGLYSIASTHN